MDIKSAQCLTKKFLNQTYWTDSIDTLRSLIRYHDYQYRIVCKPIIDDTTYDRLFNLLISRESDSSQSIPSDSPTVLVWTSLLDSFNKSTHRIPMLSLQNTYTNADIEVRWERCEKALTSWTDGIKNTVAFSYLIEPKLDWSSVQVVYTNGILSHAATRWNGYVWEDITKHIRKISTLPHSIPERSSLAEVVLRAEVVMPQEAFERVNAEIVKEWWQVFANPRNAASWTLRNLDASFVYKRWLQCYVFEVLDGIYWFEYDDAMLAHCRSVWLPVYERIKTVSTIDEVTELCSSEEVRNQTQFGSVACDGLVIKLNHYNARNLLGSTEHHPRWAIAYKYPAQEVIAHLRDIHRQVWRTWVVTPVALLDPVTVSWVVVQRATLHNFAFINDRALRVWVDVRIKRSGEVIPYVIGRVDELNNEWEAEYMHPTCCPVCDQTLLMSDDYKRLVCVNITCPAQQKERLKHYVSRDAANIDGMWWSLVELFFDNGFITTIQSLYAIDTPENAVKAMKLEWVWTLKWEKITSSLTDSKNRPFSNILFGIGIVWVWKKLAKTLTQYYAQCDSTIEYESLYEYLCVCSTQEKLVALYGVGSELSSTISQWIRRNETKNLIMSLENYWVLTRDKLSMVSQPLSQWWIFSWKTIVITWTFEVWRKALVQFIEESWWTVTSSVSQSTNLIIVGEKPWSKAAKAKDIWIERMDSNEFMIYFQKKSVSDDVKQLQNATQQTLF